MFDHLSAFQQGKLWLTNHSGLSKDALHVYIGLLILFGAARLFKWRVGDWRPWLVVLAFAVAGEAWDIRDVIVINVKPELAANWHDIWNTCFWPAALTLLVRYTHLFRAREITE
ncbi:MAG: hypothetical protein WC729_18385 [Sphingomonas sp.]|uniref:hypothetical protein n=1 Tax=Sphingomonas sp. TaxID=28214 RepID=UPI003562DAA7